MHGVSARTPRRRVRRDSRRVRHRHRHRVDVDRLADSAVRLPHRVRDGRRAVGARAAVLSDDRPGARGRGTSTPNVQLPTPKETARTMGRKALVQLERPTFTRSARAEFALPELAVPGVASFAPQTALEPHPHPEIDPPCRHRRGRLQEERRRHHARVADRRDAVQQVLRRGEQLDADPLVLGAAADQSAEQVAGARRRRRRRWMIIVGPAPPGPAALRSPNPNA